VIYFHGSVVKFSRKYRKIFTLQVGAIKNLCCKFANANEGENNRQKGCLNNKKIIMEKKKSYKKPVIKAQGNTKSVSCSSGGSGRSHCLRA